MRKLHLNGCLLGGKIDVWAKALWKKYSKTIVNYQTTWIQPPLEIETRQDIELTATRTEPVHAQIALWQNESEQLSATQLATIMPGEDPQSPTSGKIAGSC